VARPALGAHVASAVRAALAARVVWEARPARCWERSARSGASVSRGSAWTTGVAMQPARAPARRVTSPVMKAHAPSCRAVRLTARGRRARERATARLSATEHPLSAGLCPRERRALAPEWQARACATAPASALFRVPAPACNWFGRPLLSALFA